MAMIQRVQRRPGEPSASFRCPTCGDKFHSLLNLEVHRRLHKRAPPGAIPKGPVERSSNQKRELEKVALLRRLSQIFDDSQQRGILDRVHAPSHPQGIDNSYFNPSGSASRHGLQAAAPSWAEASRTSTVPAPFHEAALIPSRRMVNQSPPVPHNLSPQVRQPNHPNPINERLPPQGGLFPPNDPKFGSGNREPQHNDGLGAMNLVPDPRTNLVTRDPVSLPALVQGHRLARPMEALFNSLAYSQPAGANRVPGPDGARPNNPPGLDLSLHL